MDSTSLLIHLIKNNYSVFAISFNYGQKHFIEIEKACKNVEYFKKKGFDINHEIIDISDCSKILDSSLTSNDSKIPKGFYMEESMKETVVPNRNSIFMSFLFGYSLTLYKKFKKNISLSLGVHSGDHAIYPDCRPLFYEKIFEAFKIGNWESNNLDLYIPYINKDKTWILKDAIKNCDDLDLNFNEIFRNTITSYEPNSNGVSDGKTGSDIERILAFDALGLKDPIKYKYPWEYLVKHAKKLQHQFKINQ